MTSDTKLRRRASSAASRSGHVRGQSRQVIKPKSIHTSDEFVQDFLSASFDPAAFLNAKLPPLAPKSSSSSSAGAVPLADLSQRANALLSQLNAQTTRLSSTLTQLTDDILRSGSRLAYEVELLRGETLSLDETLHETLQDDIKKFIPGGINGKGHADGKKAPGEEEDKDGEEEDDDVEAKTKSTDVELPVPTVGEAESASSEPTYVQQLRTLTVVRSRIETVVKTFGDAMNFGFPPSEISVSSSFLSVSAPEPGSHQQSSEEKGQQNLKKLRDEIGALLRPSKDSGIDPVAGIEQAANRIEELKELNNVWRGTAEEKGRGRFIESLAKMVEDRHKELMRELDQQQRAMDPTKRATAAAVAEEARPTPPPGGFGLISQLQKLRSGL